MRLCAQGFRAQLARCFSERPSPVSTECEGRISPWFKTGLSLALLYRVLFSSQRSPTVPSFQLLFHSTLPRQRSNAIEIRPCFRASLFIITPGRATFAATLRQAFFASLSMGISPQEQYASCFVDCPVKFRRYLLFFFAFFARFVLRGSSLKRRTLGSVRSCSASSQHKSTDPAQKEADSYMYPTRKLLTMYSSSVEWTRLSHSERSKLGLKLEQAAEFW